MNSLLETFGTIIENNYFIAPLFAFLAGVLTSFSPCCLSSIPLIIGYVGGSELDDPKKAMKYSIIFSVGRAITYTALGVIAVLFGEFLSISGDVFYIILSVLLILMLLEFWGVINIIPQNKLQNKNKKKGSIGAFIAGLLAGIFSSPCSTPVLIVLLAMVGTTGNLIYGIILLLIYSLGHSIIIIASGTSISYINKMNSNPKFILINKIAKIVLGMLMLALALYLFYLAV